MFGTNMDAAAKICPLNSMFAFEFAVMGVLKMESSGLEERIGVRCYFGCHG